MRFDSGLDTLWKLSLLFLYSALRDFYVNTPVFSFHLKNLLFLFLFPVSSVSIEHMLSWISMGYD